MNLSSAFTSLRKFFCFFVLLFVCFLKTGFLCDFPGTSSWPKMGMGSGLGGGQGGVQEEGGQGNP